ncbi:ribonuclease HI family protein [Candidatus Roizmanbacteria bacterium]|nr:ribonuclease HI family protein [Candidatus Roizmanbacteria bacterium]
MILKIYTDGGSKGNPGPASIGFVFYQGEKIVFKHKESIGIATNNDAEYTALIRALENVKRYTLNITQINCYSDSRLMVNQVNGMFKVKNARIKEYILKIRILEQEISLPIFYRLIPREQNTVADSLVNAV